MVSFQRIVINRFLEREYEAQRVLAVAVTRNMLFPYVAFVASVSIMLAKMTSRNRLTLPKAVTAAVESTDYFDVTTENGRIVLTPVRINRADGVRAKLAELGLTDADVSGAVVWARSRE